MKPENDSFLVKHLSKDEFSAALRKGQGRALLHVKQYGLEGVADLILEACIHNQVYDQQIEAGRGDWLFWMFGKSSYLPEFKHAILDALETETDAWNLKQLSWLTYEIAASGDTDARSKLKEFVFRIASGGHEEVEWLAVYEWLLLEGEQGALDLSRVYGQRLLDCPDAGVNEELLKYDDFPGLINSLQSHAEREPTIKAYLEYLIMRTAKAKEDNERVEKKDRHARMREKYPMATILQDAKNKEDISLRVFRIFGMHATKDELQTVYAQMLNETDPLTIARLLWVFGRAELPHLDPVIFDWANGNDQKLRIAAINALARVKDEKVHALARKKAETHNLTGADSDSLDLFELNYENGDAVLIIRGLTGIQPSLDDAHRLGMSIRELAEKYTDPDLVDTLLWVYENTPCGFCRYVAVKQLAEWDKLPTEIRFECQYDAEDDTREFVQNHISQDHN